MSKVFILQEEAGDSFIMDQGAVVGIFILKDKMRDDRPRFRVDSISGESYWHYCSSWNLAEKYAYIIMGIGSELDELLEEIE